MSTAFDVEMSKHECYRIRALNADIEWLKCQVSIDCFTAFDEENDDDIQMFPQEGTNLSFTITKIDDDEYDILMSGTVVLSDTDSKFVISKEGVVDYAIDIETCDGDAVESDEDFELVENYSIVLAQRD